eukprot:1196161-Amphidinium_carterae.1
MPVRVVGSWRKPLGTFTVALGLQPLLHETNLPNSLLQGHHVSISFWMVLDSLLNGGLYTSVQPPMMLGFWCTTNQCYMSSPLESATQKPAMSGEGRLETTAARAG